MRERIVKSLHELIEKRNKQYVDESREIDQDDSITRCKNMHKSRGAEIVKSFVEGDIIRTTKVDDQLLVDYAIRNELLIRIKEDVYLEEHRENRRALFEGDELITDSIQLSEQEREAVNPLADASFSSLNQRTINDRSYSERSYDRREAVRYAERWWDDYNPEYRKFENNCTNFISQCLRAGGLPMSGHSDRSKGWWYRGKNWSYSWSVAHAMRWHLSGSKQGLRGEERESASELEPGDIICYDFNGDGRWQHTTIVVAKDANGEPLVNAQTANSRMRYWKYEDSTAYTPNIKYKFFHIVG
ncbi:amidase domain-containing protein [Halalkalibacter akibai]|uniref:Putative amidase domain-containing protein n=1 Tax=Halalkalibacter akibai (strain ATCC 43226 / DSM 21942 / CIP 109018 / JCM 9157 / 1139) TaxID=1236973 RepID=W4QVR1_HALA3|nr:amidase domain-containing protein [Halalkalibacter akibai]GAE36245.1 hypothetical protein JCM9157_3404 [Halalkalibacter akibai JCM 9157]